jgi:hypothetical protein
VSVLLVVGKYKYDELDTDISEFLASTIHQGSREQQLNRLRQTTIACYLKMRAATSLPSNIEASHTGIWVISVRAGSMVRVTDFSGLNTTERLMWKGKRDVPRVSPRGYIVPHLVHPRVLVRLNLWARHSQRIPHVLCLERAC